MHTRHLLLCLASGVQLSVLDWYFCTPVFVLPSQSWALSHDTRVKNWQVTELCLHIHLSSPKGSENYGLFLMMLLIGCMFCALQGRWCNSCFLFKWWERPLNKWIETFPSGLEVGKRAVPTVQRCQGQGRVESWGISPMENLSLNNQEDHFHEGTPFVLSKASEVWRDVLMASCSSSFLPGTPHARDRQHRAEAGHWSELGLSEPVWGARSQLSPSTEEGFSMLRTVLLQAEEERGDQGCVIAPSEHLFILHPTAKGKQPHLFLSWESKTKVPWSYKASWG